MEQLDNQVVCSVCGERYNLEEISAYTVLERENAELVKLVESKTGLITVWKDKCSRLEAENAALRKRLEPIEEYWQNSKSIKYVEITSAHASIKKCMEMAPETDEDGKNEER